MASVATTTSASNEAPPPAAPTVGGGRDGARALTVFLVTRVHRKAAAPLAGDCRLFRSPRIAFDQRVVPGLAASSQAASFDSI